MATATANKVLVGVFKSREAAHRTVDDLKRAGYRNDQIGLVGKSADGTTRVEGAAAGENTAVGVGVGAAGGAAVAAAASLGMTFGVLPVIGPILAIGPLAAALLSAAGGAAAGGVVGALVGWGVSDEDAAYYEGEVGAGRYLVTLDPGDRANDAWEVFTRHGGYDRATRPAI